MVLIRDMLEIGKERTKIHEPVKATYTIFHDCSGTVFQIDTYGSADRECTGKVSQTIQFDKKSAIMLIEKLKKTFDLDQD